MEYVIQGVLIATLVAITLNTANYFGDKSLQNITADLISNKKKDTAFAITNFKGQALFSEKCTVCHSYTKRDGATTIAGFAKRTPDERLLYEFIRNNAKVIQSGNPYYNALYKEYGVLMTPFPELTDQQISDIIEYMKQAEKVYGYE